MSCPISITQFPPSEAPGLVLSGWYSAQNYAQSAFSMATQFIQQLGTAAQSIANLPPINVNVGIPTTTIDAFVMPTAPVAPDMTTQFPTAPAEPTLTPVTALDVAPAPTFDVVAPAINTNIAVPAPLSATVPVEPALDTVTLPTEPSLTMPSAPTLYNITLPDVPTLTLLDFYSSHEPGQVPLAPDVGISFAEQPYSDALMDALKARLMEWISGTATGLPPDVEQAIWERGRVRENMNMLAALDTAMQEWSAKGYNLPQGALVTQMQAIMQDTASKNSSLSRDVMVKQAELEQTNIHFALEQSVQLEHRLLSYANDVANRALEVSRLTASIAIDVFNAKVAGYNASIQAYLADAQVYRTQIEAETRKVELYRAEIDAQRAIGELNQQQVQLYHELIVAQMARVDLYKTEMEAARIVADINRVKIDSFRALIEGYTAQVQAKTAEFEQYATQVRAEGLKVDLYKSQAEAYNAVVNGYAKNVDALVAVKNSEIKIEQELPLETYRALMSAFVAQIDGESKRVGALADVFKSNVQAYSAEVSGEATKIESETHVYTAESNRLIADANVQIEAAKAQLTAMTTEVQLLIEAMRSGSQVSAQLAASALSAVNLSGSISDNQSLSMSSSVSSNSSCQDSNIDATYHNYNYSG